MNDLKRFLILNWYPKGKSDSDLARLLKVHHTLLSKWLTGVVEPPIERKVQIAKALKTDSRLIFLADMDLQERTSKK